MRWFRTTRRPSFDVVIDATSAALARQATACRLADGLFAAGSLAYSMMYGKGADAFQRFAGHGAARIADGLGMLVEQAAEAFCGAACGRTSRR